jgi:hypothetical protein
MALSNFQIWLEYAGSRSVGNKNGVCRGEEREQGAVLVENNGESGFLTVRRWVVCIVESFINFRGISVALFPSK